MDILSVIKDHFKVISVVTICYALESKKMTQQTNLICWVILYFNYFLFRIIGCTSLSDHDYFDVSWVIQIIFDAFTDIAY